MIRVFSYFILLALFSVSAIGDTKTAPLLPDYSSGLFRFQHTLANKGNAAAQYSLGEMYEMGVGVSKDEREALVWFKKAAAQGHNKSIYKLLFLEIKVNGLSIENKKQLDLLKKEANAKNPNAQYYLGKMYAAGIGVPKDIEKALVWLNKATFYGDSEAEDEAIAIDEELVRNKLNNIKNRKLAVEQRKAEKKRINALKKKQRKQKRINKQANEKKLKEKQSQDDLHAAMLEERELADKQQEINRLLGIALAEEDKKREAEAQAEAKNIENAKKEKLAKQMNKSIAPTFQSSPCKGKSAKFLSICR